MTQQTQNMCVRVLFDAFLCFCCQVMILVLVRLHSMEWSTLGIYQKLCQDEHASIGAILLRPCLSLRVTTVGTLTSQMTALGVTPWTHL